MYDGIMHLPAKSLRAAAAPQAGSQAPMRNAGGHMHALRLHASMKVRGQHHSMNAFARCCYKGLCSFLPHLTEGRSPPEDTLGKVVDASVSPHHESFKSVLSQANFRTTAHPSHYELDIEFDGMWTEVIAVLIIALANVVCYITHEKSLLHGHLRLPKILFISNR